MNVIDFENRLIDELSGIKKMLMEKNAAYGNSVGEPLKVFSDATVEQRLFVRIDDKISRIMRGHEYADEDTIADLIGYLIILSMYRKHNG